MTVKRTEELNSLHKLVILRQIDNDHGLDLVSICRISHDTCNGIEYRDEDEYASKRFGELSGFTH